MESAVDLPSSKKEIPSKPEACHQENSSTEEPTTSMAAANQPDNETVPVIKESRPLDGDQGVDETGEVVPMDTSLSKEETGGSSKMEPDTNIQRNTPTPPDMQEGEQERSQLSPSCIYLGVHVCVCVCVCMYVHVCVRGSCLIDLPAKAAVALVGMLPCYDG